MLKVRIGKLLIDERYIIMHVNDASKLELKEGDRVIISSSEKIGRKFIAVLMLTDKLVNEGEVYIPHEVASEMDVSEGSYIRINLAPRPKSIDYIKKKMSGYKLTATEIKVIIEDIVYGRIGKPEIMAFALSQHYTGMDIDEIEYLTKAMIETGDVIEFDVPTYDKHSIGGVPGNKVSLLIVPIVAAAGLTIPKTSSRAITSPSGTADTMEVLANVEFTIEEIREIVSKTNGALVWGGALNLAPADDIIIRAEKILGIDPTPQMLASIMAKKVAAGIKTLVLDIPTGKETKMEDVEKATQFARLFLELGNRLGIRVQVGITYGEQPVGHAVGPALEAKEALEALIDPKSAPASLVEKSCSLAGLLLEMGGKAPVGMGYQLAKEIIESGKAYEKMREIIEAQGGDPNIKPDEISLGEYRYTVYSPVNGFVTQVSNKIITEIARAAGAPKDKGAGVYIYVKRGRKVNAGDKILEIFAERATKLQDAIAILQRRNPIVIEGMLLRTIPERQIYTLYPSPSSTNT